MSFCLCAFLSLLFVSLSVAFSVCVSPRPLYCECSRLSFACVWVPRKTHAPTKRVLFSSLSALCVWVVFVLCVFLPLHVCVSLSLYVSVSSASLCPWRIISALRLVATPAHVCSLSSHLYSHTVFSNTSICRFLAFSCSYLFPTFFVSHGASSSTHNTRLTHSVTGAHRFSGRHTVMAHVFSHN